MIEVLVVIAITAVIIGPLARATTTLLKNSEQAIEQNAVLPQVQNAGYWISRDVQMARTVTLGEPGVFLRLDIPVDTDENNDYRIDYFFDGNKLKRQFYDSLGTLISETFIADYIDTDNTTFSALDLDAGLYKLTIRASRDGTGVTRSYEVEQRLS